MSNKRSATSELNHDNWNDEEAPEEMGTYKRASANDLKMRPMKRAKRRGLTGDNDGPSVFSNFKGFGTADSSAAPTFSFLSNDGEKPKLSIGGSFPSFSFSKSTESDKAGENKSTISINTPVYPVSNSISALDFTSPTPLKINTVKGEIESSSKPLFKFSVTDTNESTSSVEPSPKSTFSFGVPTASKSIDKPVLPSFSVSPSKKEGAYNENGSSKPEFKFGAVDTNKNATSVESSPKSSFSFGVPASNKNVDNSALSSFNFNPSKPVGDSSPAFKFGINASEATKVNHSSSPSVSTQQNKSSDNTHTENSSNSGESKNKESHASKVNGITDTPKTEKKRSTLFLANLKALNLGVMKWVQQHLEKNQYINLIPIFEDYKTHFEDIKKRFDNEDLQATKSNKNISNQDKDTSCTSKNSSSSETTFFSFGSSSTTASKAVPFPSGSSTNAQKTDTVNKANTIEKPFSFDLSKSTSEKSETNSETTNKPSGLIFNFGKSNSNPAFSFGSDKAKSSFTFGSVDNSSSSNTSDFSFGTSKPSSFNFATSATDVKPVEESKDDDEVVQEEQMPEIKEEGAVYEKKAKLFHKKKEQYETVGVGTLYIKPVNENDKTQLIVRADNSLGTVLLNILLNDSIPTQRVGKNNVLIICIPNPPLDSKAAQTPASILIRVKTGGDADELFEKLNHYKKLHKSGDDTGKDSD